MAIQYTPALSLPYPQVTDAPLIASRDLRALAQKMDSEGAQIRGESSAALTAGQAAEALAAQALARANAIEDPIHVGPDEPTGGEELWVDTDEDAPLPSVSVSSEDITDATAVGRAVLTAPLSVNARNALSIFTGTRALLDAGTDTAERTWDAKELHEYVTDTVEADVTGLADRLAALEYDSGERDITSLAGSRVTGGKFLLRRVGKLVTLSIVAVVPSSTLGSGSIILTIPSGFQRPSRWDGYIPASATTNRSMFIFSTGGLGVWSPSASDSLRADLSWTTDNPIPATPPGDPT